MKQRVKLNKLREAYDMEHRLLFDLYRLMHEHILARWGSSEGIEAAC
jgi:hypothetical protein